MHTFKWWLLLLICFLFSATGCGIRNPRHYTQPANSRAPAVLNIYVQNVMSMPVGVNLPRVGTAVLTTREQSLRQLMPSDGHFFHRVEMTDSGQLRLQSVVGSTTPMFSARIRTTMHHRNRIGAVRVPRGEHWLVTRSMGQDWRRIDKGRYELLTTTEFARQHPAAYNNFVQGGYHLVFQRIPPNTDPPRIIGRKIHIEPRLHPAELAAGQAGSR